jgi:predicted amidohydrolase YtcJ
MTTKAALLAALVLAGLPAAAQAPTPAATKSPSAPAGADLVLLGAKVYTLEPAQPWAEAIAVRGDRIVKVGTRDEVKRFVREGKTRVLDLEGRLVLPGLIDNHTHFASAGRLLLGLNLLEVDEPVAFKKQVGEAARRLPAGAWLVGGDWGAYGAWAKGSTGAAASAARPAEFLPTKDLIDEASGDHPALVSRFDGKLHLANTLALRAAKITSATPNPDGGEILRGADGEPNGLLRGTASKLVEDVIPPPVYAQRKAEALRALQEARRFGVTTFHDNVADFDQLQLFRDLQKSGELTSRVWGRMWLSEWEKERDYIRRNAVATVPGGWGDDMIRLGGLKAWVDGIMGNSTALFFEPYKTAPDSYGRLRPVMFPEGNLYRLIKGADRAGFTVTVHAIGDRANRILLDTYERVFNENPPRDRRFRVVHAQVMEPEDQKRFGRLGLVAEVQPYHAIDDMRWMEERIGSRAENAYAFRGIMDGGAAMSFGSDWPGTNASYYPINPLLGMYAAVTRQTPDGKPDGGWFPRQRISLEDAVRFYTWNNAYVTFEEDTKGSLKEGKLADIAVLDRDIFSRPPRELIDTQVLYTILGGKVVKAPDAP